MNVKKYSLAIVASISVALCAIGCQRSYRDAELVGSWKIVMPGGIQQTYTFEPDHTFTIVTASTKDLRYFGDWAIESGQLVITVRSNSFTTPVTNRTAVRIAKLTEPLLVLKDRDINDESRERTFQRVK
jgi:hypothetical protein